MSTVTTSIKLDEDVKKTAQSVAKSAGLTLSALINSYLRQVSATRRIDIYVPEEMTPRMEKIIAGIEAEIAEGKLGDGYDSAESFLMDLKNPDSP